MNERTRSWGTVAGMLAICMVFLILLVGGESSADKAARQVDFQREIRPLLSDRCFHCHGPDRKHREARLRLDTREGAFRKSTIVPGEPGESELIERITAEDEFDRMPPAESGKSLTPEEIETIRLWIEQGAEWKDHWSFVPPECPPLPAVKDQEWVRNEVDRFILARLEKEGLTPSPEADRRTLIRRATFDLTGLPPTLQEVEAFVEDDRPDAYERLLDRLLASPRYGEHMARYWLDAARYGDTHGLHLDNLRIMWPYRDWVIDAYNRNMPFDRFSIEQLAGDLLPDPTLEQRVATGFNRCNVTTSEGGAIAEEFLVRYAVDRVETTSTVWMGLTAGCAACHDHKFDPITQKEFYQLFAYFNNITEPAMDGNRQVVPPFVKVPRPGVEERRASVRARIEEAEARRRKRAEAAKPDFGVWLDEEEAREEPRVELPPGMVAHFPLDEIGGDIRNAVNPEQKGAVHGKSGAVPGQLGGAFRVVDGGHIELGSIGDYEADQAFSYGAWIQTPGNVTGAAIAKMDTANSFRGWDLYIVQRRVAAHLIHRWSGAALKVTTKADVLEPNRFHHVFITYDGSRRASGVKVYVDGQEQPTNVNNDSLGDRSIRTEVPLHLGRRRTDSLLNGAAIDDVRVFERALIASEVQAVAGADPIGPILALPRDQRSEEQSRTLYQHFLENFDEPYQQIMAELEELRAEDRKLEAQYVTTLVMQEREERRPAYVLHRGEYDQRREQVEPGVPAMLPPLPADAPANRLGFARWLMDPSHPLTARVAVNRYWQRLFGTGIVKTQEDFGSQGAPPTHPELLDWLATEFVRCGWDVKGMNKLLMMSATYRQSSRVRPEILKTDPENRLLARGPRFRLDAEMLRDQALSLGGLLVEKRGGRSVKPPQPAGLWFAVGYSGSNTVRFEQDAGEDVYRRSLYTFWKRTAPPPAMSTFDAPSRESCIVRRERTNTPLQALLVMNDRQYFEAARGLAGRALKEAPSSSPWARASYMFQLATARSPDVKEMSLLLDSLDGHLEEFRRNPDAARELIQVGDSPPDPSIDPVELAAWTMVGNLILNLDEVINKA